MNYNIIARIRKDKKDKKGLVPIYIFIYEGEKVVTKNSIGHKINPDHWDETTRRVNKLANNSALLNSIINKEISELETRVMSEHLTKGHVDFDLLLKKGKAKDADFFEFCEKQIKEKDYSNETRRNYTVFLSKIKAYKPRLRISEVNFQFLQSYEAYLRNKGNVRNTLHNNMKFISTMLKDAERAGLLSEDPFKKYKKPGYRQTERTFLDMKEVALIEKWLYKKCKDEDLQKVATYFLFMCYTGLRYSDAVRFRSDKHVINNERIVIETQKTGKQANLFLNDRIRPLLPFLSANPQLTTQADFNRKLKLVAAHAGVEKKVTSHVARHSFGSSLVDMGVPVEVAKGLLAHGSANTTKIYYHLKDSNLDEAMKKFNKS